MRKQTKTKRNPTQLALGTLGIHADKLEDAALAERVDALLDSVPEHEEEEEEKKKVENKPDHTGRRGSHCTTSKSTGD